MLRFVRSWSAISRSLPQFAPARRPHARRRPMLECLESRSLLSTITLTVNSLADASPPKGVTTLREAITKADANSLNNYTIKFSVRGVIDLTTALPNLTDNISINGGGNILIRHDANAPQFTMLKAGGITSISGLTFFDGNGGAITCTGNTTITRCTFFNNSSGEGGAIYDVGVLTIKNSNFYDNHAEEGGAIAAVVTLAQLTATGCNFTNNTAGYGGAIFNQVVTTVTNSVFADNSATIDGGAICNYTDLGGGIFNSTNNIFSGNNPNDIGTI